MTLPAVVDNRFMQLLPAGEQNGRYFFRIATVSPDNAATLHAVGELIEADPEQRSINYSDRFVVRVGESFLLTGLGSKEKRRKDGPRGLQLQASWRRNCESAITLTPAEFEKACIGRVVERRTSPLQGTPSACCAEIDRVLIDDARQENLRAEARRSAARVAGWKDAVSLSRLPKWAEIPDASDRVRHAAEGTFALDKVLRTLLDDGRILYCVTDREGEGFLAISNARMCVVAGGRLALEHAQARTTEAAQYKADAERIGSKLAAIIEGLDGFLTHIDHEDAELFLGVGEPPPADDEKPWRWIHDSALSAVEDARVAAADARTKLAVLRDALKPAPYGNGGARDHLGSQFLGQMAFTWECLTGETPGKSGKGRFFEFSRAGWALMGWEPKSDEYFSKRIERGEHLRPWF